MTRIVSVWLPHWPIERLTWTAARKRRQPPPDDRPFILAETGAKGLIITAANGAARTEGITPGLALTDARARVPHLLSAPAEPEEDARALAGLGRWCGRYAPSFNTDGTDGLWIDIKGAAHLFGGEQGLLDDLESRLAGFGFTARLGLADTLGGAWALARYGDHEAPAAKHGRVQSLPSPRRGGVGGGGISQAPRTHPLPGPPPSRGRENLAAFIAPPNAQADAIASLPVESLRLEAGAVTLLNRLGLKRIGQLDHLPRASLKRRFPSREAAQAVLTRLDQALGAVREPLKLLTPPPYHLARLAFTEPLISNEGFEAALEGLARDLCAQLARALSGARIIAVTAYRSDGSHAALRSGLAGPCRAVDHMLRLLRERVQEIDVGDGVDAMTLAALAVEHLPAAQISLAEKDDKPSATDLIDSLSNRLTAARVYHAVPHPSHIPERAEIYRPAIRFGSAHAGSRGARTTPPRPPLLLERPEPIEVLAEVPEGPPVRFTWRRVTHRIRRWQGPERIAPEWWRALPSIRGSPVSFIPLPNPPPQGGREEIGLAANRYFRTRDYYRIEDEAGFRYWVFRAGLYGREEEASGSEAIGQIKKTSSSEAVGREEKSLPRWYLHGVMG